MCYNENTEAYDVPYNASCLGTMLKKLCKILIMECIRQHDKEKQTTVENFKKILEMEYGYTVNKTVAETLSTKNRYKKVELPQSSDIIKFNQYLEKKRASNMEILQNQFLFNAWKSLSEVTLIIIQIFNRRRAGELERTLINDYKNSIKMTDTDEEYKKLQKSEKKAAKNYIRFTIRGKLNRTVPVLLNLKMMESIETILKYRQLAGVSFNNPYLFGMPSNNKTKFIYLRACKLMREYSAACGASNVVALRGTSLRKHIATKCVSLNLSENEVSHVANFMGHRENIHKQIYRQPVAKVDILGISKILEQAQNTSANDTSNSSVTKENTTDISTNLTISDIQETEYISSNTNENKIYQNQDLLNNSNNSNNFSQLTDCFSKNKLKRKRATNKKYSEDTLFESDNEPSKKKKRSTPPYGKTARKRWTVEEKKIAFSLFGENIRNSILPSFNEIIFKTRTNILKNRSAATIKTWLHNQMRNKKI